MKKYIYRFISDSGYFNKGAARRALDLSINSANFPWAMFVLSLWWDRYISSADGGL